MDDDTDGFWIVWLEQVFQHKVPVDHSFDLFLHQEFVRTVCDSRLGWPQRSTDDLLVSSYFIPPPRCTKICSN